LYLRFTKNNINIIGTNKIGIKKYNLILTSVIIGPIIVKIERKMGTKVQNFPFDIDNLFSSLF
jgi:hypothetical protein